MTNDDLMRLRTGLQDVASIVGCAKFAYLIARNFRVADAVCKDLESAMVWSDEYKAFDNKRLELLSKHALKNEDGTPVVNGNGEVTLIDRVAFNCEFDLLKREHDDVIAEQQTRIDDFNVLMKQHADESIDWRMIPQALLPDGITGTQVAAIFELIEEEAEEAAE